ncbi:SpoIID/LytB domain-containing protein [Cellulomonas sp. DKR-3]|uniref:SpoIID/LytB domain-containing protein n=1 Tax=Cellulomonas fulva TaxID=2835530 RepID=A0ABS5TZS4_9CELL|nr:SpoIID/LytB domain-containing protein [Cellulomonas fulva]MBT0994621.1 SpoIID/LytB domain-containing protein [Cellulomonas fulva]
MRHRIGALIAFVGLAAVLLVAPPAAAATPTSALVASAVAATTSGSAVPVAVSWVHQGAPVTGRVNLQRRSGSTWVHVRQVAVTDGVARTSVAPTSTTSYRLRASSATEPPGTPTTGTAGTSATVTVQVVGQPLRAGAPHLSQSTVQLDDGTARLAATWTYAGRAVTGTANLQRNDGAGWVHVKRVTITKGAASITTSVPGAALLRLRAVSADVPGLVVTSPYGLSEELRFVPGAVRIPSSFSVVGAGYGHGVGMSQYGAYGMALDGAGPTTILQHYYSGSQLASTPTDQLVRVQVRTGTTSTSFTSSSGKSRVRLNGAIATEAQAGTPITVAASSGRLKVTVGSRTWTTASANGGVHVEWQSTRYWAGSGDVTVKVAGADANAYRWGRMEIKNLGGYVNAVDVVQLGDEYLYGLAEVPSSWPMNALRAQVVAARSYAWADLGSVSSSCDCHLYDDTRSQVFRGWDKVAEPYYGARWKAAVDATIGAAGARVLTANGSRVKAYFFSSSGGRTENSEDVWSAALSYTRSVDDHWSSDPAVNPNWRWSASVSQSTMRSVFGLPDVAQVSVTSRTAGGSADVVRATSSSGATRSLGGQTFRSVLGLKGAWISSITG